MTRSNIIAFIILCFSSMSGYSQAIEICDNGIDDDQNGFIDLNDEKCKCAEELPSSLIPNPSFEDRTCCPEANAMLNCAVGWVQASAPTTDYINTCGDYLGNTSIPAFAPLPLADGQGAVGFRDGQFSEGPNYKEYVGACLTETMKAGVAYRLQFFVGFRDNIEGSKSLDIAIFGGSTCNQLPFGGFSTDVGCPANTITYDEIDVQFVSGSNEWVPVEFEFIPTRDYNVMIVGPSCEANPNTIFSPYFYLDGLTLAETSEFGLPLDNIEGSICNDDLVLSIEEEAGQTYQWYKDGVALVGETNSSIFLISTPETEGNYLVVINLPEGCVSSRAYNVRIPPYYADYATSVCEKDTFSIGSANYTESGIYETTISAADGCDSIITLDLEVVPVSSSTLQRSFCEGDTFRILDIDATRGGNYSSLAVNARGCDSTINLILEEITATDGIEIENVIDVLLGDKLTLEPNAYDPKLISFTWTDEENNLLSESSILEGLQPIVPAVYTITGVDQYGCDIKEDVMVRIDRSSANIYTPNIFSPDGNGVNDYFKIFANDALESIDQFIIFDRWGNEVYYQENITNINSNEGWDGFIKGKPAQQGVYGWMVKARFIDDMESTFSGDLTLIRL